MRASGSRERGLAAAMALVTLAAGVTARSGILPAVWAKYAGVGLWCALVYWLVVLAWPRVSVSGALIAAWGIGWAVEFLQLTPGPAWLASRVPLSKWVLGTTFNAPDLAAYVAGAVAAAGVHWGLSRWLRARVAA